MLKGWVIRPAMRLCNIWLSDAVGLKWRTFFFFLCIAICSFSVVDGRSNF